MNIRIEQPGDTGRITEIHYAAFKDHPMHVPGAEPTEQRIVEVLRESNALSLSLLAEKDAQSVGHIAYSPAIVGQSDSGWFLLGPVGVLPEHQGRGIGSALIRESLRQLRDSGAAGVVLVGDPAFYERFGFKTMEGVSYPDVPDQFVMALSLSGHKPQGAIIAHEAFMVSAG